MSYTITWTEEALTTFEHRITYLKTHWTEREIINFKKRVSEYLQVLEAEPLMAKRSGRFKDVHMGLILKQVSLIYRVRPLTKEIELIRLSITGKIQKELENINPVHNKKII